MTCEAEFSFHNGRSIYPLQKLVGEAYFRREMYMFLNIVLSFSSIVDTAENQERKFDPSIWEDAELSVWNQLRPRHSSAPGLQGTHRRWRQKVSQQTGHLEFWNFM